MRFLFLIVPAAGHINPSLALAEGLIARGHEVVYYLPEPFTALVAHTRARVRTLPPSLALPVHKVPPQEGPVRFKVLRELMIGHSADSLQEVPRLVEWAREDAPDAVVYDPMCLWGQLVAKALRRPSVTLYTTFPLHPRSELLSRLMPRLDLDLSWGVVSSVLRLLWTSERLHWSYKVPRLRPRAMFMTQEELSLVPFPREFQPEAHLFDERYQFVGPLITPRPHHRVEPWVESLPEGRTLYVSLGTMVTQRNDLFRLFYEAFGGTQWQVVLATGGRDITAEVGPAPANFISRPRVPQLEVLSRATLFVTHSGMNSTMEAMWYGVPVVGLPQMPEQSAVGEQAARSGLGLKLEEHELSVESLRKAVSTVAGEPRYRERAAELRAAVRRTGGAAQAVEALLRHVEGKLAAPPPGGDRMASHGHAQATRVTA